MANPSTSEKPRSSSCFDLLPLVCLITMLIVLFVLPPSKPKISLLFIYVPSLNIHQNSTYNPPISYSLLMENSGELAGVLYENTTVSLYDNSNTSVPIGTGSIPSFYQDTSSCAAKNGRVREDEPRRINWSSDGFARIRINVGSRIKFQYFPGLTKKRTIAVSALLPINQDGMLGDQIKLTSDGTKSALSGFSIFALLTFLYAV